MEAYNPTTTMLYEQLTRQNLLSTLPPCYMYRLTLTFILQVIVMPHEQPTLQYFFRT